MTDLLFAAIADDDTGASDLAGMLAEQGMRTLLVIDLPTVEQFRKWSAGFDAVVMAEGTRNLSPDQAYGRTREAIRIVNARNPKVLQIKYCSTFDSTVEGNIGQSIDAAMDELGEAFTVALPALPVNGRTTYQGYHFVQGQLLSDSPMRDHPLTPMTNPNLVDLLGRQTKRQVGLAGYNDVEGGPEKLKARLKQLRNEGVHIAVVDCLDDDHLETICRASGDLRLITGSSAFGIKMPAVFRESGLFSGDRGTGAASESIGSPSGNQGCLVVAGSCSLATRNQNEWWKNVGHPVIRVSPRDLLDPLYDRTSIIKEVVNELSAGKHCLLTTTAIPADVRQVQEWGNSQGLSVQIIGERIAYALADLVLAIVEIQNVCGLIVAGGETSGAICRRLELGALRVGRNIDPGVPLCFSLGKFRFPIVLKSGNFGSTDFYAKGQRAIHQTADFLV
jgi:3-dehydrotetronate 4-kinase